MGDEKAKQIKSAILKTEDVRWKDLLFIQPENFKEMTKESYGKLRESIVRNQFVQTFNVWETDGRLYCLDGYHRIKVMRDLEAEGYVLPESFPANFIDCKNRKEELLHFCYTRFEKSLILLRYYVWPFTPATGVRIPLGTPS